MKFIARSASDNTDDWPAWMIWNGHLNVTGKVMRAMYYPFPHGMVFMSREHAEQYAALANEMKVTL
jgi:hypothetical protein